MSQSDDVFLGSIPDVYDEYLVPLIFEQYAEDLAARTGDIDPGAVLEVAAGSGVVSRAVAPILDVESRYVVTDLSPAMLERAARMQQNLERIEWRSADALDLPFAEATFDLVLCQFGAMFFPDRVGAYAEARRVLRPGGRFVFNMWDRIEENDFADEVTAALAEACPQNPPKFLSRTPHGHHEPAVYRAELEAAGFTEVAIDTVARTSTASDPAIPAIAYCQGTPLRNEIEAMKSLSLGEATKLAADAIRHRFGSGTVRGRIKAFVVTAH